MVRLTHFSQVNAKCITLRSTFGAAIAFALCLWLLVLPTSQLNAQSACGQTVTEDRAINGEWASGCDSQDLNGRHAQFYTFTLDQQSAVTITLESSVADPFLYLRVGDARSGPHLHLNDDHGGSDSRSQIAETLDAGTYTVEATTWGAAETGSFILTISGLGATTAQPPASPEPPSDSCLQAVTAKAAIKGEWARGCESQVRPGSYARFYTFTLGHQTKVTIILYSRDVDPSLYLREGNARSGAHLFKGDDWVRRNSSEIAGTLEAGTYTIEATTWLSQETSSFIMKIAETDIFIEQPKPIVHSSSTTLLAGEDVELVHESGARIKIPRGATDGTTIVSIDEVEPPEGSDLGVGRVFEFSVGTTLLVKPATIYIPYELRGGQRPADIDALRWDEELQAWEVLPRRIDHDHLMAEMVVDELGSFTTDPRNLAPIEGDGPVAIPEIIRFQVGGDYPFIERETVAVGQNMIVQYSVRNVGTDTLSVYGENAAGQIFLTSPGPVQKLSKLNSHVESCFNVGVFDNCSFYSPDKWKSGVVYPSTNWLGLDNSDCCIRDFVVPLEQPGFHTVRLELVFWDDKGREIARDVVEKEVKVTENPLIERSDVEVDGRVYSVEGKENAQGKVEYNVTGPGGSAPDRQTKDKAVYTAAVQQAFRSPINWGRRLLEFVGGAVESSLPYLEGAFFGVENLNSILTVLLHPSPAAKANAGTAISGSVLEKLILNFADHPEEITKETALEIANQAQEKRARWMSIREETGKGKSLSFDRAIEAQDNLRFHNAYWKPAGYAVTVLTAPDFIVDPDVTETVATGSIGPIEYFLGTDFLEGAVKIVDAVSVLGDLGIALEEFEPWNEMKRDIKANLSAERTEHAEILRRLLITDHAPFELPALGVIVIPHYEKLLTLPRKYVCQDTVIADAAFTLAGEWASGCASEERDGSYARFYTFTLSQQSEVTITLESSDADTYLYLREGHARSGAHVYENNDHNGSTSRSQIVEELAATTYTVEATTWGARETGNFTLTVAGLGTASDPSPGPKIDPVVESPSVSKSSLRSGESFTLSVSVRNQGDDAMASTSLRYYRSTNSTISSSDTVVGRDEVGSLAVGQNSPQSITLIAPTLVGTYYYGACVPPVPGESDTQNNCSDGVRVTVEDTYPDLVVQFQPQAPSKSSLNRGESFTLSFVVRNQGDGTSPSTTLRYYRSTNPTISSSDTEVGSDSVVSLGPNVPSPESIDLTAPSSAGTYYGACVDSVPGESNTTNNCSSGVSVTVTTATQGAPDLVVYSPSVYDKVFDPGERFNMAFWVRNEGDGASTATATLKYYRSSDSTISSSDTELTIQSGTTGVGPIAASERTTVSVYLNAHSSGVYYYGACVGTVPNESDTSNNCAAVFKVTLTAPDLVIIRDSVNSSYVEAGDDFTFRATVRNDGTGDSPSTLLRYYRSSDATISTADTQVDTDTVSSLEPDDTDAESVRITVPSTTGTYYYGVCVDAVTRESDTTNNCSSGIQVTVTEAGVDAPDLTVDTPVISGFNGLPGDSVRFDIIVRNQGEERAGATTLRLYRSTDSTFTSSDRELITWEVAPLNAGSSRRYSILNENVHNWVATLYYGACVDSVTDESDTTNNCSSALAVTTQQVAPDLVVESESVSDSSVETGDTFTFSATVRNQGDGTAGSTTLHYHRSTDSAISSSDTEVGSDSVVSLGPNVPSPESIDLTAPSSAGTYYYGACVDSVPGESSTTNNCSSGVSVTVSEATQVAPDLVVESPSASDSSVETGQSFTFSVTVRNGGDGESTVTLLRYYRSTDSAISTGDTQVGTDLVEVLDPSDTHSGDVSLTAPSDGGTYYYGACVDSVPGESDTTNNCSSGVQVTVTAAPQTTIDLAFSGAPAVSDDSLETGDSFTLSVTVRNGGSGSSAATTLRYYRSTDSAISTSDTEVGTDPVGALGPSGTEAESISLTAPDDAGRYYYGACVDSVTGESDTANNCSSGVEVTVTAAPQTRPDLVVESPGLSDSTLGTGDTFTLSATVRNQGDGTAGSTTLHYHRSTDSAISSSDTEVGSDSVVSLGPNVPSPESIDLTAPSSAGTYYYGACVDSVPGESNTTNNCSSGVSVTVTTATQGAPDLVVYSPSVYDKVFDPGERFNMAFWVRNEGDGASTATATLKYYRSSDSTISSSDTELTIQSGTTGVGPIAASERTTVSVYLNAHSSGVYYYGACVGTVPNESDTSNNCAAVFKVTLTAPDLVIIRDSVNSSYVEAGDDFTFRATVRNDGTGDSPSTLLRYYRSSDATISTADTQVDTDTVSSLEPDDTDAESVRITVPSTTGTYYYGVCVDAVTRESDTTNNCSSGIQVTVTEAGVDAPDLTVDTPVISGFNGLPGDSVRFDIIVRNQGEERAGATTLRLYRSTDSTFTSSDRELITWEVAPLNAGSSRRYSILNENVHNWVATLYYGACVDSVTDESDTTNNCSSALAVTTQ